MTHATLKTRTLQRLDEDTSSPVFYSAAEVTAALNVAQRIYCLLTLCLEASGNLALTANTTFYSMLSTFSDWILPLKVRIQGGAKVSPSKIEDFHARSRRWVADRGAPERYAHLGFHLFAITPCPSSTGTTLVITRARSATELSADGDISEIPEEHHSKLIDFAVWLLRTKEGGEEFIAEEKGLQSFFEAAGAMAAKVRARNKAAGYDQMPPELKLEDVSRMRGKR